MREDTSPGINSLYALHRSLTEHWEVAFLKRYCSIKTGSTPSTKESKFYDSEDINWFTPGDFQSDILFDSNKKISDFARACNACKIFPARSIYMIGIGGTIGKIAVCNEIASANQQINIIIPNRKVYYKYVHYCQYFGKFLPKNLKFNNRVG